MGIVIFFWSGSGEGALTSSRSSRYDGEVEGIDSVWRILRNCFFIFVRRPSSAFFADIFAAPAPDWGRGKRAVSVGGRLLGA